jgi:branched-chain amino acid transport system ATP-binding protein
MSTPLLQASGLSRRFGGLVAVDGVSLDLHRGQVHAVIGTNGAGKSTLINLLSGEIPVSGGEIRLDGRTITTLAQPLRARAGIGRSYQRTTIFPTLSVLENCRLAAQASLQKPWTLWQAAGGCRASVERAVAALEAAGLGDALYLTAGSMSHGKKRQLEIAMCLATAPQVLLLDEPLAGMGAEESERMLAMLERLRADHAILLVEHDMDAVFRVADRITVMVNGAVIASGSPELVRSSPEVQRAYLGEAHVQ